MAASLEDEIAGYLRKQPNPQSVQQIAKGIGRRNQHAVQMAINEMYWHVDELTRKVIRDGSNEPVIVYCLA